MALSSIVGSSIAEALGKKGGRTAARDAATTTVKLAGDSLVSHGKAVAKGLAEKPYLLQQGLDLPATMSGRDMGALARYLKGLGNRYDLAEAAGKLNVALGQGVTAAPRLTVAAEEALYTQRGVTAESFAKLTRSGFSGEQLASLRGFADAFATSQGGKYLTVAAAAGARDLGAAKKVVARQIAADMGIRAPQHVDSKVLLSLVRDMGTEDPRDARTIANVANELFAKGTHSYYTINEAANRVMLGQLGAGPQLLSQMAVKPEAFKAALPALDPAVARAEQLRLLRDRLRVLPEAPRQRAVGVLGSSKATLLSFDQALGPDFDRQIAQLVGDRPALAAGLTRDMAVQQRANLLSDLVTLPEATRKQVFAGLAGEPDAMARTAVDRLTGLTEQRFGVHVYRTPGAAPMPGERAQALDWTVQGATELYNGLDKLTRGKAVDPIRGTTYVHLQALEGAAPAAGKPATLYRPGGNRYRPGQDGLMGAEYRGMGYREPDGDKEWVAIYDTALKLDNSNRAVGISRGTGTVVHETGHVAQLHGPNQQAVADWSRLSGWREPDGQVADGVLSLRGKTTGYYKDPEVQLGQRQLVVSQYAATDPVEDWAEFTRTFVLDPALAMQVSGEKFLYMNQFYHGRYTPAEVQELARRTGLDLGKAAASLKQLLAS